jgi:2,3-bisphosphoglycerate-dependent phosphoglycerate mutase
VSVEIVFETHSLTEDNESGIATGWLPGRLSEAGRRLADELGERRRSDELSAVFTSDLARAVETAELAFEGTGVPIYRDARLRECKHALPLAGGLELHLPSAHVTASAERRTRCVRRAPRK